MKSKMILCFLLSTLGMVTTTRADEITYSGNYSWNSANTIYGSGSQVTGLSIPQFAASQGILGYVKVSVSTQFSGAAAANSNGGVYLPPFFVDSWTWSNYYYATFGSSTLKANATSLQQASGSENYTSLNHSQSVSVPSTNMQDTKILTPTTQDPNVLLPFLGTGVVPLTFEVGHLAAPPPLNSQLYPGGFHWNFSTITSAGMNMQSTSAFSITYGYVPVPEPTTILGVGMLVLIVGRFRKAIPYSRAFAVQSISPR